MTFTAVLLALLVEQLRPLPRNNWVHDALIAWTRWAGRNFNAGRDHHAWVVWSVMVVVPAALVFGVHIVIGHFSILLALLWNVAVLYVTLGFRQFSHYFTGVREALEQGDEIQASQLMRECWQLDASELSGTDLLRHVIEHSLLAAHRHVFGVFFWFVALSLLGLGPTGAVIYRMAEFASRYWAFKSNTVGEPTNDRLMALSSRIFNAIDHFPARLTACGFAIVGNFEDAVNCWRRDAILWTYSNEGVILAAAAGAVGLRLGGAAAPGLVPDASKTFDRGAPLSATQAEGSTTGVPPELGHLSSIVGLVWRAAVMWMLLLGLLSLASLIG